MATAVASPNYPRNVKLPSSKCVRSGVIALGLYTMLYKPTSAFGQKLNSRCCFFYLPQPLLVNNFKRMAWSIRSSVDNNGLDPSPTNGPAGTTRLIRAIQAIRTELGAKSRELRRDFPLKVIFFLVGFYCATAYATVIGQTGDWDILSAAFSVVIVEGIGALMYKASVPILKKMRKLITMFNYWKAGLSMGLFLDSFKYEINDIFGIKNVIGKHRSGPNCNGNCKIFQKKEEVKGKHKSGADCNAGKRGLMTYVYRTYYLLERLEPRWFYWLLVYSVEGTRPSKAKISRNEAKE